jgi:hypothetical protein
MNLHALALECSAIAEANGFDVPTWENLPTKVMFIITEIVEAADARDSPEALAEEFADIAIRTLSILERVWGAEWSSSRIETRRPTTLSRFDTIEVLLWPATTHYAKCIEDWRHGEKTNAKGEKTNAKIHLEMALLSLWRLSDVLEINLEAAIVAKSEKNKTRGHLHGKARSEG